MLSICKAVRLKGEMKLAILECDTGDFLKLLVGSHMLTHDNN